MSLKRIFTGTFIDRQIFSFLYGDLEQDFKNASKGKWVEPENLHFTYQFIGDTEESVVDEITGSIKPYLIEYNSTLKIKGLGAFPDLRNPKVLFANVINPEKVVFEIQMKTSRILEEFGYKAERHNYNPHITLQRIKFAERANFRVAIDKYSETEFGRMSCFKFSLIESILTPRGAIYKIIG